ncbi:hypothetical protein M2459_002770 [Parabacteroides sp. PF5-5]|uniref:DUF6242 domain-containing protein n=1 Tax=unclassified Parabacteroides TaxID=2649774 RepID=UPI0024739B39|nr:MULTISPECIES: DUF6242 domain-containing protein [unclassified Parabacteroides]MDH6306086.1 hypothetical protein [Parabacteroides sp. PH5-39]MDH6317016.1 hypothetical protein [Parabacteroides sp. PF5-13]MDH6320769.1 hypothetical protein [Parabacteroides sp. PH5-13]MDH6324529.1 hypothetical protein [Parabacteroides sp. PH5-8]MDH6328201.1 hypothetical protein [Parabacteroides sp. PH5-41]
MKNKILLFITGCITLLLASCLNSDDENTDYTVIKDAQIRSLTLSHDSVSGLSSVKFTIDQLNGKIFNLDSLPYGTEIEKVSCKLTYVTGVLGTEVTMEVVPDSSFYWNGSDSLDFSKPVKFKTYAYDGVTTKTYTAWVNIHQVDPDSMVWELYANNPLPEAVEEQKVVVYPLNGTDEFFMYTQTANGYQLYHSPITDAKNWEALSLTGLPSADLALSQMTLYNGKLYAPSANGGLYGSEDGLSWSAIANAPSVKYLLGAVAEGTNQAPVLSAIIEAEDNLYFAGMNKEQQWLQGSIVPERFPLTGFGAAPYNNMYHEYLLIVGGRNSKDELTNTAWATMDGQRWALLSDEKVSYFKPKEGIILTKYDDKMFLAGGIESGGKPSKEIYTSTDYGITWSLQDTLIIFPSAYKARGFSSVYVDNNNYMLIFGGKTSKDAKSVNEIWRGRINRLATKD